MSGGLLSALRNCGRLRLTSAAAENAIATLKNINLNGTNVSSLKNLIDAIPLRYNATSQIIETTINNIPFRQIERFFRNCDLTGLVRQLKLNVNIPSGLENNLKRILDVPDWRIRDVEVTYTNAKTTKIGKNIDVGNINNVDGFITSLPSSTRTRLDTILKKMQGMVPSSNTLKRVGIVGSLSLLGGTLLVNLVNAANEKKGCYMVRSVNGSIINCKLPNRSCINTAGNICDGTDYEYNPICWIISKLLKGEDLRDIFNANETVDDTNLEVYLADSKAVENMWTNYDAIKSTLRNINVCAAFNSIDNGNIPACRACNVYAEVNSSEYFDADSIAENITLKCVENSSVLEALVDAAVSLGMNIISELGGFLGISGTTIKYIIYGFLILVLLFILYKVFSAFKKKN